MQTLNQRVASASRGFGGNLAVGITAVADAMRIVQGVAETAGQAIGLMADQLRQGFASNVELERATVAFRRYTDSAEEAAQIVGLLRREAAVTPFSDQEIIAAGRALIGFAQGSSEGMLELVRVAERLAVLDPFQGIEGGVRALQEALGGSFESLVQRFEIPRQLIQRLREEGVPNLEIVKRALEFRGIDAGAVEAFGRSFEGLLSTIQSFGQELRQLVSAGLFEAVGQAFGHTVRLIERYGDQLRTTAAAIGEVVARMATGIVRALAPVTALLDALAPGFREAAAAEFAQPIEDATTAARRATPVVAELNRTLTLSEGRAGLAAAAGDMERLQSLSAQTAAPMAVINRELGDLGVRAAEIQIGADRTRRAFEDQLRPLQRQLDLLQDSADVQRLQNQLASNRALTERLRLQAEVNALERAGAGADPTAEGLSPRQRALALALQERRLRLEQLDADKARVPAIQELQRRIADLRRQEQDALAPSEALLAQYRDRVAVLQTESQRWQNLRADIDLATGSIREQNKALGEGPGEDVHQRNVQTARERGQALADAWLTSFQTWVDANGGTAWTAIATSLTKWTLETGVPTAVRVGGEIAAGVWKGFQQYWEDSLRRRLFEGPSGAEQIADAIAADIAAGRAPPGALPVITAPGEPPVPPGGGTAITVNVGDVVAGVPGLADRLRSAVHDAILAVITASAQVGAGPQQPLPGNVR